ncbi:Non-specific serine/threonine protein kinase [Bertholletia excelsa]
MSLFLLVFLGSAVGFSSTISCSMFNRKLSKYDGHDPSCPLDFDRLRKMEKGPYTREFLNVSNECHYIVQGFRLLRSDYLRSTGRFSLPASVSEACWRSFQAQASERLGPFDVRSNCRVPASWISNDCMKVANRSEFESFLPENELEEVGLRCNRSLAESSVCDSCINSLSSIKEAFFNGTDPGNSSDCTGYPYMYAAAFANQLGPFDLGTAKCLFSLDIYPEQTGSRNHAIIICQIAGGWAVGLLGVVAIIWFLWIRNRGDSVRVNPISGLTSGTGLLGENTNLVKYELGEMKEATGNFSMENLIGKGRYGNVYKGVLANGSEVALKRFKNCSASGDTDFAHEIKVIASVKHVNLITLRGYCTGTDTTGIHHSIIVCDLVKNGSLYDHLFGSRPTRLSWPMRRKIAFGTARGLAYLHSGTSPSIIHRDIKASNILLDENFESKLADFGLAKFTPDGLSHLCTKVAGTIGYVAPEYAMYGQLTKKSDVYSFGIVLLELLSGKEAVFSVENGQTLLLTDWAWSLVKKGQTLDVIDQDMVGSDTSEVMEKYVIIAVLCTHSVLHARPSMEQIVRMFESKTVSVLLPLNHPVSTDQVIEVKSH